MSKTEKDFLHEQIAIVRQEYQDRIKPFIDRLVAIESMNPSPPISILIGEDQLKNLPGCIQDQIDRANKAFEQIGKK